MRNCNMTEVRLLTSNEGCISFLQLFICLLGRIRMHSGSIHKQLAVNIFDGQYLVNDSIQSPIITGLLLNVSDKGTL